MLNLGKYRLVILLTGLFLVIFGAVMVLTFVISRQIATDAVSLNLAGQQRTQVQQLVKTVLLLEQGSTQGVIDSNGATSFSELKDLYSTVDALNAALTAFREGGMQLESGARVALTPQDDVSCGHRSTSRCRRFAKRRTCRLTTSAPCSRCWYPTI